MSSCADAPATTRPNGSASMPRAAGRSPARLRRSRRTAWRSPRATQVFGSIWASRPRELGDPDPGETRVLAAAADQIGGALERDRLQRDATSAEISRRSDALKSALLDSVSHDLRTPLASIRAAAGTLMDPDVEWPPDQRREIAGLDRPRGRVAQPPRDEPPGHEPRRRRRAAAEPRRVRAVRPRARGHRPDRGRRWVAVGRRSRVADDLPPVLVDEVLIGQVLANTLDNAAKYAGPDASDPDLGRGSRRTRHVRVTIEDGGPGVPDESLPRLFEKFYRVPRKGEGSRRGTGIGLAVVRGSSRRWAGRSRPAVGSSAVSPRLSTCRSRSSSRPRPTDRDARERPRGHGAADDPARRG